MKYSLVSPKAFEDEFEKAKLFKEKAEGDFSGWIILALNESERFLDEDGRHLMLQLENHVIEKYLFDFKNIQDAKVDTTYVHNAGFDKLVKINRKESHTGYATNQSNIEVDFKQLFRYGRKPFVDYYIRIFLNVLFIPVLFPVSLGFSIYWIRKNRKEIRKYKEWVRSFYKNGDILPAIIISLNPTKIAVMTDLSKHFGYYPIIKVMTFYFTKLNGKPIEIGDKLPINATYFDEENHPKYWSDIWPIPVEFATNDRDVIGEKRYSVPMEDWNLLEDNLYQINIEEDGVYKLKIEGSSWFE